MKTISTVVSLRMINVCVSFLCAAVIAVSLIAPMPDGQMTFINPASGQDAYREPGGQPLGDSKHFRSKEVRFGGITQLTATAPASVSSAQIPSTINCTDDNYFFGLPMPAEPVISTPRSVAFDVTSMGDGCPKVAGYAAGIVSLDLGFPELVDTPLYAGIRWVISPNGPVAERLVPDIPGWELWGAPDSLVAYDISPLGNVIVGKLLGVNATGFAYQQWGFTWNSGTVTRFASNASLVEGSDVSCVAPALLYSSAKPAPSASLETVGFISNSPTTVNLDPETAVAGQCLWPAQRTAVRNGAAVSTSVPPSNAVSVAYKDATRRILLNVGNNDGGSPPAVKVMEQGLPDIELSAPSGSDRYGESLSEDGKFAVGSVKISPNLWRGVIWDLQNRNVSPIPYQSPNSVDCTDSDPLSGCGTLTKSGWFRDVSNNGQFAVGSIEIQNEPYCNGNVLGIVSPTDTSNQNTGLKAVVWVAGKLYRLEDYIAIMEVSKGDSLAGWHLCEATSISAYGDTIAGVGVNPAGERQAFVVHFESTLPYMKKDTVSASGINTNGWKQHVAVGDFDGDHTQDVATIYYSSQKLSLAYGRAGGGYDLNPYITLEGLPISIVAADFNKDGLDDLAIVDTYGKVSILDGTPTRSALTPRFVAQYGGEVRYRFMIAADINNDQKLDLAIATNSTIAMGQAPVVNVALGNGDGTFGAANRIFLGWDASEPFGIVAADFDNDGDLDLATPNRIGDTSYPNKSGYTASIIRTNVDPSTQAVSFSVVNVKQLPLSYPYAIATGDFDADGNADLAVAYQFGGVTILFGDGQGVFGARTENGPAVSQSQPSLLATDFNADGATDLLVTGYSSKVEVYQRGLGTWTKRQEFLLPGGGTNITEADINGDGKKDFAVATTTINTVTFLRN